MAKKINDDGVKIPLTTSNVRLTADTPDASLGYVALSGEEGNKSIDWEKRILYGLATEEVIDWGSKKLTKYGGQTVLDWENAQTHDANTVVSVNWDKRQLYNREGEVIFDWKDGAYLPRTLNINNTVLSSGEEGFIAQYSDSRLDLNTDFSEISYKDTYLFLERGIKITAAEAVKLTSDNDDITLQAHRNIELNSKDGDISIYPSDDFNLFGNEYAGSGKAYYKGNEIATLDDLKNVEVNTIEYTFTKVGINGLLLPDPFQYHRDLKITAVYPNNNVVAGSFTATINSENYDINSLIGITLPAGTQLNWDNDIKAGMNQSTIIITFEKI